MIDGVINDDSLFRAVSFLGLYHLPSIIDLWHSQYETGKKVIGILSAQSERSARQQIKASNLTPISLQISKNISFFRPRVSKKQLLFATRQIATLLDSGIAIDETLKLVDREVKN